VVFLLVSHSFPEEPGPMLIEPEASPRLSGGSCFCPPRRREADGRGYAECPSLPVAVAAASARGCGDDVGPRHFLLVDWLHGDVIVQVTPLRKYFSCPLYSCLYNVK
jgi:hypothetical protein